MIGAFEWLVILVGKVPALVFWLAAIIFGTVMLRRGGGRAERFFIAGAGIKILGTLLSVPWVVISLWLHYEGYTTTYINSISTGVNTFLSAVSLAGILCLLYAFWVKFKTNKYVEILA
jgi:hypothetical protein